MSDAPVPLRPRAPLENCPDVEDCLSDATEIGRICAFGPVCGTCVVYRPGATAKGLLAGSCRLRPDRGVFGCTAPICDAYIPRAGAPNAKGETASARDRLVPLPAEIRTKSSAPAARAPLVRPVRPAVPNGPVGELEMTRDQLKALIREAMDEERGGGDASMAPRWEGGSVVIKPGNPALQSKEISVDSLFHKVVMIRDRLRVLEQKINANPKLTDGEKIDIQSYVTKCYGSLTTFNVLFQDKADQFQGEKDKGDA
jgi:hypothetical protein